MKTEKTLGIIRTIGPLQIPIEEELKSNAINKCLHCGVVITLDNDSGWEAFTGNGGETQSLCKKCNNEMNKISEKAQPIDEVFQ